MTRFTLSVASGVSLLALAFAATAQSSPSHLLYLPSTEAGVDQAAIVDALGAQGFQVSTYVPAAGENRLTYARRVAREVRGLMQSGVAASNITVVGAGTASPVATLTSAVVGDRNVNYVLLGRCDPILRHEFRFRMSGRVLGLRDGDDSASHSCRSLWNQSPRVSERRDVALQTGQGAALFHSPRSEWLQPLAAWSKGG